MCFFFFFRQKTAYEIVDCDWSSDVCSSDLVGMCDYNLKRGFKEVFNTTVFGYLRDRRLERAQQLLLEPWMSVAEAARTVGYDSHASFTTAFKRKYGISPKAYQVSARQ